MNKKRAFIFPGQGAQYVGMGKDFYDSFATARETFEEASDILSFDIAKLVFEGPESDLMLTKNSQAAIFVVSVAIFRSLEQKPRVCAGLSLGEYTALFASEKITFQECLPLVYARGQYMHEACEKTQGTMRVVLGLDKEAVSKVLEENVWIANLNCPGQVVIAGRVADIEKATEALKAAGAKRILPLDVSGAFHTPLMEEAQRKLMPHLNAAKLRTSDIEFVMNVPGTFVQSLDEIRKNLIAQVASPTFWEKGVRAMLENGVENFVEIGPGKTLAGMNKKIGAPCLSIEKLSDLEAYASLT